MMKRPRFDLNKLMDMHGEGSGEYKLELGMWSRILWEPHISTRTTLLFLPAPLGGGRGERESGTYAIISAV